MNLGKHLTVKHKLIRRVGGIGILLLALGFAGALSVKHSQADTHVVSASGYNVNSYISTHNIKPVKKITKELHKFEMFKYSTSNKRPNGIVFHWTASGSKYDTARNEADYEINGGRWKNAFVHTFIDSKTILNIHDTSYGCWGAGPKANARFVQFEFCNVEKGNEKKFAQSITNAAYYTAYLLRQYGLKPTLATKSGGGTLWTHHQVSSYLGGTDHTDPDEQFSRYNYSMSQFSTLVKKYYAELLGAKIPVDDGQYVTVTQPSWDMWQTLSPFKSKAKASSLGSAVYQSRVLYYNANGNTYLSLYDNKGNWRGYINDKGTQTTGGQGKYISFGKYVTFTKSNYNLYKDFSWTKNGNTSTKLLHHTYLAKGEYKHFNGSTYYSLYDHKDKWVGYVNADSMTVAKNQGGVAYNNPKNQYVAITRDDLNLWKDLEFKTSYGLSKSIRTQPVIARVAYQAYNGMTYESLYTKSGKWLGYINKDGVKTTDGVTINLSFNKYVTITKPKYIVWNDFTFKKQKANTTNLMNHVYLAKWQYNHQNGSSYYSLYNDGGSWAGYLNRDATKTISGKTVKVSANEYAAIAKNGYSLWKDLSFKKELNKSQKLLTVPLKVKAKYYHANGSTYYELYDRNNKFLGYMNSKALKKTDGVSAIQSYNKYVTLKKTGYSLWSNFLWGGPMNTSNGLLNKTFLAKGRYFHVNGSTYLTLYDHNNKWKGYINALGASVASNAGGVAINYNKSVKVSRKSYPFWSSFSFSHQRGTTTKYLNKTVTAKYKYVHYNGSTYYSIYSGSKWLGYVNATATVAKKSTGLYGLNVSKLSSANQSFLKTLIAYAIPSAKKHGLYTSILVAQAVRESAWGTSELAKKAHAYFGVKADSTWKGATYTKVTKEYYNGAYHSVSQKFRKYSSFNASIDDYGDNILKKMAANSSLSYKLLLKKNSKTWTAAVKGLKSYATSPAYVTDTTNFINQYQLYKLDQY
ncbi:glucosaminidase domain-containing protein [Lacticaseibacillus nasuensis]|nr:glucosaminidase domain-containing protein [Lacticaseibacillus nasuensis]